MRAVTVRGIAEARAALACAGRKGVMLLSAPGAASWPGPDTFAAITEQAACDHPLARYEAVLDCGNDPGAALDALRRGWQRMVLHPCPALAQVVAVAETLGAGILVTRPEELDLRTLDLRRSAVLARLTAWLSAEDACGIGPARP